MKKNIQIKLIGGNNIIPKYATEGSAGIDLHALLITPLIIRPWKTHLIRTGVMIHIGDANVTAVILPRSGLGHNHGIILGNSVGLIDSDYQGEIKISCWNRTRESYTIEPDQRIAQLVFLPVIQVNFDIVENFTPTYRANNGFGSTG